MTDTETTTRIINDTTFHIRTKYLKHFRILRNNPCFGANYDQFDISVCEYRDCIHIFHCADGPAIKGPGFEEWIVNGIRHRDDGPSYKSEYETEWRRNGRLHRIEGPAKIIDGPVNMIDVEIGWYLNGRVHRTDGPAVEQSISIIYRSNGRRYHRSIPAVETIEDGRICSCSWFYQGGLHRYAGPAVIEITVYDTQYNQFNIVYRYQWWRFGVRCSPDEEDELTDEYYHDRLDALDKHLPIYSSATEWIDNRPLLKCISNYMRFETHLSETHLYADILDNDKRKEYDYPDNEYDGYDTGEHDDIGDYANYQTAYESGADE
jgi:hypothetical protein